VKGVSKGVGIDGVREVESLQEFIIVRRNGMLHGLDAAEAMKACDFTFIMIGNEEVMRPREGPGYVHDGCVFISGV